MDHSFLDNKYFVDGEIYNCPFCKRRHVKYSIVADKYFHWSNEKGCYIFLVKCHSCRKISMHLSFNKLPISNYLHEYGLGEAASHFQARNINSKFELDTENLDEQFFYSVPTSFFVLDNRIPKVLRELVSEAEGSMKSNFLTGASACVRKVVYELAVLQGAMGDSYDERIKSLKDKLPNVDPTYFDTLLTIQQVASTKVHEESYDGWENKHLRVILSALSEALNEIYVVPAIREEKRRGILALRDELTPKKAKTENE